MYYILEGLSLFSSWMKALLLENEILKNYDKKSFEANMIKMQDIVRYMKLFKDINLFITECKNIFSNYSIIENLL